MSTRLSQLLAKAEELAFDIDFSTVKTWKEKTGRPAIGYLPIYVPRELLHAQGCLPVGVLGAGDNLEIIRGDAYYQSYICHLPRSVIELGLSGRLDVMDGMLFPAICDVIRNLSGMWKMLAPDKLSRYLDVPQNFDPETGGLFYRHELEELSRDLVELGALPLTDEALRASIAIYNRHRVAVQDLYRLRQEAPWKVPSSELYLILRAGVILPVEEHLDLMAEYESLVCADNSRKPMDQARVLLTGSFCEQPPLGLIKTLERSGCYIVDDDLIQVHRWIQHEIPTEGDPMDNLVEAFLTDAIESPTRYIDDDVKGAQLVQRVKDSGAEGLLFCAPSFCDPALLDQPMAVAAVEREGIPWTSFLFSENTGQFQVIREQAGTFADSIKLWS